MWTFSKFKILVLLVVLVASTIFFFFQFSTRKTFLPPSSICLGKRDHREPVSSLQCLYRCMPKQYRYNKREYFKLVENNKISDAKLYVFQVCQTLLDFNEFNRLLRGSFLNPFNLIQRKKVRLTWVRYTKRSWTSSNISDTITWNEDNCSAIKWNSTNNNQYLPSNKQNSNCIVGPLEDKTTLFTQIWRKDILTKKVWRFNNF